MAARFSRLIVSLLPLTALPGLTVAAQSGGPSAGWVRTITAEELRRAGILRLGEALRLVDGWDLSTVDEYTWRGAPSSTIPFQDDGWTVLVDGVPLDPGLLGVAGLERLPLDLEAIDSLQFVAAPRLAAGTIADRGLVHIHTRRPASGLSVRGRYGTGQETGDPGPFEFVPPARENRDRYGHDVSLGAAYGGKDAAWYVAGGLGLGLHIAGDAAVRERLLVTGGDLRLERLAPSLRMGLSSGAGRHTLLLGRSDLDDAVRLEAFGSELPAESTLDYAAITGGTPAWSSRLCYRLAYERTNVRSSEGAIAPRLDVERTTLRSEVEVSLGETGARDFVGIGVARSDVRTPYALRDDPILVLRTFGSFGWRLSPSLMQRLSVSLDAGAGSVGAGAILEQDWRAGTRDVVSVIVSANRPLRADDGGLYSLTARGYDWLRDAGVPVSFDGPDESSRAVMADAAWSREITGGLALRLSGFYRAFTADYLARRELSFDAQRLAFRGPVRLASGRRGQAAGLELQGEGRISRTLTARLSYRVRWVVSGGDAIEDAWDRVPRHSSRAYLSYAPVPGFALWARLAHHGGIRWADYRPTDLDATIPGVATVDLSVEKYLWDGRLRGGLSLRNLFDARLRFHPEGGTAGRAVIVTVGTVLPAGNAELARGLP